MQANSKIKTFRPITPGKRAVKRVDRSSLWKGSPVKNLTEAKNKTGGRNNQGRRTSNHIGGGAKHRYRIIDFLRTKTGRAEVQRTEYDPNRTAFISLIKYEDGTLSYIIAPDGLSKGMFVSAGEDAPNTIGCCKKLENIPIGSMIHNIELVPSYGAKIVRSAGSFAVLAGKETGLAILKLPSGRTYKVSLECKATIGQVSNVDHFNENLGNAGTSRHMGKRPWVRGVAKNPVDHAMGGRSHTKQHRNRNGLRKGTKTAGKAAKIRKMKMARRGMIQ